MRAEARLLVSVALLVGVATQWTGRSYLRSAAAGGLIEDVALATSRHDDLELVSQAVPTFSQAGLQEAIETLNGE